MKIAFIILVCSIAAFLVLFFVLGIISRSGQAPGLVEGKLSKCPDKPNCVCSEQKNDSRHHIEPIVIPPNSTIDPLPILRNIISDMGGTITAEKYHYIAVEFSSAIFGFADDFEIRLDSIDKVIHMRSAARVGYSDMGINKKRTEVFRQQYLNKITGATQPTIQHQ
jgi:uncharacterized protein (DUF1499 family)